MLKKNRYHLGLFNYTRFKMKIELPTLEQLFVACEKIKEIGFLRSTREIRIILPKQCPGLVGNIKKFTEDGYLVIRMFSIGEPSKGLAFEIKQLHDLKAFFLHVPDPEYAPIAEALKKLFINAITPNGYHEIMQYVVTGYTPAGIETSLIHEYLSMLHDDHEVRAKLDEADDYWVGTSHLSMMLITLSHFEDAGKANRWLGYVQGVLVSRGVTDVEREKERTRNRIARAYVPLNAEPVNRVDFWRHKLDVSYLLNDIRNTAISNNVSFGELAHRADLSETCLLEIMANLTILDQATALRLYKAAGVEFNKPITYEEMILRAKLIWIEF